MLLSTSPWLLIFVVWRDWRWKQTCTEVYLKNCMGRKEVREEVFSKQLVPYAGIIFSQAITSHYSLLVCKHTLLSSIMIIYLEAALSASECSSATSVHTCRTSLNAQFAAAIGSLQPQQGDLLCVNLSLSRNLHQCHHSAFALGERDWLKPTE